MPKRIQRKRTKGWRMPENCVYVGRPTKWGNPFKVGESFGYYVTPWNHQNCVALYEFDLDDNLREAAKKELAGKDLACFCPLDRPCHADVLLEIANED